MGITIIFRGKKWFTGFVVVAQHIGRLIVTIDMSQWLRF